MKKDQIKKEHEEDIEKAFKDLPDIVINIRHEKDDSETEKEKRDDDYATWLLRSGMQDGDDTPSRVLSILPRKDNKVLVNWEDMGHLGSTTFSMTESDGVWKICDATVPKGFNPL